MDSKEGTESKKTRSALYASQMDCRGCGAQELARGRAQENERQKKGGLLDSARIGGVDGAREQSGAEKNMRSGAS
jgi:hypothetical protein